MQLDSKCLWNEYDAANVNAFSRFMTCNAYVNICEHDMQCICAHVKCCHPETVIPVFREAHLLLCISVFCSASMGMCHACSDTTTSTSAVQYYDMNTMI